MCNSEHGCCVGYDTRLLLNMQKKKPPLHYDYVMSPELFFSPQVYVVCVQPQSGNGIGSRVNTGRNSSRFVFPLGFTLRARWHMARVRGGGGGVLCDLCGCLHVRFHAFVIFHVQDYQWKNGWCFRCCINYAPSTGRKSIYSPFFS